MRNGIPNEICPMCGSADFEWGRLSYYAYYIPNGCKATFWGRQYIQVRRCRQCSNLQVFSEPPNNDRAKVNTVMMAATICIVIILGVTALFMPTLMRIGR